MPRMTDRERLAKIEADQCTLAKDAETVRLTVRASYAALVTDLPVERLSEREFRDVLAQAVRVGGTAAIGAMKTIAGTTDRPSPPRNVKHQAGNLFRPTGPRQPEPLLAPLLTWCNLPAAPRAEVSCSPNRSA